jgi:O-antigen/teichoic acid export membrane protein
MIGGNEIHAAAGGTRPSLRLLAVHGSAWAAGGYGAGQLLRLGSNIVLAWLLFPEAFGLMALVAVFMQGLKMFSDIGIGPSIVQNSRGQDAAFLNTAWTIQALRGVALWVVACLLAWPLAAVYAANDPAAWGLVYLLPVAALTAVVAGLRSPAVFVLNRRLLLGRITLLEIGSKVVMVAVAVSWALIHPSVWALVAGALAAELFEMLGSHRLSRAVRVRPQWDRACAAELFRFGKWIFVSTVVTFVAMKADRMLLGAMAPIHVLGVYSVGVMLAMFPHQVMGKVVSSVLFPALAEHRRCGAGRFAQGLARARSCILPAGMFAVLGIILFAPPFFRTLYDERYHDAGWIAQLFAVGVWFSLLGMIAGRALLALGDSRSLAAANAVNAAATIAGCLVGFRLWGMPGFILGYAAGNIAALAVFQAALRRRGAGSAAQDARYTAALALVAAVGLAAQRAGVGPDFGVLPGPLWHAAAAVLVLTVFGLWVLRRIAPALRPA